MFLHYIQNGLNVGESVCPFDHRHRTRQDFHQKLRADPHILARSAEDLEAVFNTYIAAIEPEIPGYFRTAPEAPYGVRRLDPAAEASMTYGFYMPPTPDEPVGRYHYNGSGLDQKPVVWAGPLIYHELVPGHHFHLALQAENPDLPMFRRHYLTSTAFK